MEQKVKFENPLTISLSEKILEQLKELRKTLKQSGVLGPGIKELNKTLKESGVLGPGLNALAQESSLILKAIRQFFGQIIKACVGLSGAVGTAVASTARTVVGRTAILLRSPAAPYVIGGAAVVTVGGVGYVVYNNQQKKKKIKELEKRVINLTDNPRALRNYLKSGKFIQELFEISGITKKEIEKAKGNVYDYLRTLKDFGYDNVEWV